MKFYKLHISEANGACVSERVFNDAKAVSKIYWAECIEARFRPDAAYIDECEFVDGELVSKRRLRHLDDEYTKKHRLLRHAR